MDKHIETIARGVCIIDGKVLLCLPKDRSYSYLPGGHIEFGETGREALVREMKEETGLDATADEFLGVVESSFVQKGERHCEINLIYEMKVEEGGRGGESGEGGEGGRGGELKVESCEDWICFDWIECDKIESANLLPPETKTYCITSSISTSSTTSTSSEG